MYIENNFLFRHDFLNLGFMVTGAVLNPFSAQAAFDSRPKKVKTLTFYNAHTDERLHVGFFREGKYNTGALTKINYILRDHRSGEIKAIDFRIPGFSTRHLRNVARKMKGGGVGYYPKSDFVHVDTGHVRYW